MAGEAQKSRTGRQCVVIGNAIRLVTFDVIISFSREKVKTRALPFIERTAGCAMIALRRDRKRIE